MEVRTLTDGGQAAADTAHALAAFLGAAQRTLEISIYDMRLPDDLYAIVEDVLKDAIARGVVVRTVFNIDYPKSIPVPPPPLTVADAMQAVPGTSVPIPGVPDLMHHKYIVRDAESVWTGSTNWTGDSWTREENVIVTFDSPELAARYGEDFEQLWTKREVRKSGKVDTAAIDIDGTKVRPWFCPGRGEQLAHRIAAAIGEAKRRIRIASPVISNGPILGTLAQAASDGKVDIAGVVDRTQVGEVLSQWRVNGNAEWKEPLLRTSLTRAAFTGKRSTPYAPGSIHDYMHAKITVADDVVFVGSFNLSHSGELNAENVLEIADAALADRMASFIDDIRARYPVVEL